MMLLLARPQAAEVPLELPPLSIQNQGQTVECEQRVQTKKAQEIHNDDIAAFTEEFKLEKKLMLKKLVP